MLDLVLIYSWISSNDPGDDVVNCGGFGSDLIRTVDVLGGVEIDMDREVCELLASGCLKWPC